MSSKSILDGEKVYSTYDVADVGYGIEHFPEQVLEAWNATREIVVPKAYAKCEQIVVLGMGGSQLGPHMIESALGGELKVPFIRIGGYGIPKFVNRKTLVILSSFSGTTEEVIFAGKEAIKKGAKMMAISTGGSLQRMATKHKFPHYRIEPGELAKEPRLGVGFSLIGMIGLLERAGHLRASQALMDRVMNAMSEVIDTCGIDVPEEENPAKTVAQGLHNRIVYLVGAEHLVGSVHTMNNQINESAKQLCFWHTLPELNHHFLEGTQFPKKTFEKVTVLMVRSKHYNKRVQKRFEITADVFEDQGAEVIEYDARGKGRLEEAVEVLQFSNHLSYYMGMLNKVNPKEIPFVNKFKAELK